MVVRGEQYSAPLVPLFAKSLHHLPQIFECIRKLAVACVPVFFQPSGSDSQLIYGLMVCFVCFGAYVHFDPYEDRGNDAVARLCQMQIFFSLLASVALTSASEQNAGSNMDILLVVLYCLPVRLPSHSLGCSPLTPASVMPVNAGWAGDIPREPAAQGSKDATPAIDAAK